MNFVHFVFPQKMPKFVTFPGRTGGKLQGNDGEIRPKEQGLQSKSWDAKEVKSKYVNMIFVKFCLSNMVFQLSQPTQPFQRGSGAGNDEIGVREQATPRADQFLSLQRTWFAKSKRDSSQVQYQVFCHWGQLEVVAENAPWLHCLSWSVLVSYAVSMAKWLCKFQTWCHAWIRISLLVVFLCWNFGSKFAQGKETLKATGAFDLRKWQIGRRTPGVGSQSAEILSCKDVKDAWDIKTVGWFQELFQSRMVEWWIGDAASVLDCFRQR